MLDESFDLAKMGLWEVVMALDAPKDLELPTRSVTPTTEPSTPDTDVNRDAAFDALSCVNKKRPADDSNPDSGSEDSAEALEAKKLKRMRRNRESAAQSRERKKTYISTLEAKLAVLSATMESLRSENETLRAGRGRPGRAGDPAPVSDLNTLLKESTASLCLPASPAELFKASDECGGDTLGLFSDLNASTFGEVLVPSLQLVTACAS